MLTAISTSYEFGEPHLHAAAHDLGNGHAADIFGHQRFLDVFEFLLADDGFDFIHISIPPLVVQSVEGRVGTFAVLCDVETDLLFLFGNSQRSDPLCEEDAQAASDETEQDGDDGADEVRKEQLCIAKNEAVGDERGVDRFRTEESGHDTSINAATP